IARNELSIARGRRSYEATKEEVATTFAIPGKRLGHIEPLIENLKYLIIKEEFSGRSASSEVRLRFRQHPLEEELLAQLDASEEKVRRNGFEVPSLPGVLLLRFAKQEGYTQQEIAVILGLLKERRYVDIDTKGNLERKIDNVDDLRERIQALLAQIEIQVHQLVDGLPEFEKDHYPLSKLQTALEATKERDELEAVNREIFQTANQLKQFVSFRLSSYKEKLRNLRGDLQGRVRQGVPVWLSSTFDPSPLQDLLEMQRQDLAAAYQGVLEEVRQVYDTSMSRSRMEHSSSVEEIIAAYNELQDLGKTSEKLLTRIKSFQDRQEDFEAWRKVSRAAAEVEEEASNAQNVFANGEFKVEAEQLWTALHTRYSAQALSFLSSHRSVGKDIEKFRGRVLSWLDRRRDDFEEQCLTYQQLLANAHIKAELKIPFDRERPNESQEVLLIQVERYLTDYLEKLSEKLKASLQVILYCIQVQGAKLSGAETKAKQMYENIAHLEGQITSEMIGDLTRFKELILPLIDLADEQKQLEIEIRQATQQRPAEGSELGLMAIFHSMNTSEGIDMRSVIISLINQEGTVSLDALMHDLESMFQKNLIDIRVRLSRSERL
ncbi:MAG TPA: hypothetical protein VN729_07870, partial [Ktedonobacteraceae bacterium]|nr:hypothetical protein [Ktedonobacteraceae bacterium]